jgi:acyl carrier protein
VNEIEGKLRVFLAKIFRNHELQNDEDIFQAGFVNSMFAMQLVLFIETEFKLRIEDEDLELDNFRTINAMVGLIDKKTAVLVLKSV